jgi:hypothetical protein
VAESLECVESGRVISIPNAPCSRYVALSTDQFKYDYNGGDKCKCPVCGGRGIPWGGWYHCEDCSCIALIDTGQCFVKVEGRTCGHAEG